MPVLKVWNGSAWVDAVGGSVRNLSEMGDVSLSGPANDDFLQRKSGLWVNRSVGQVKSDLGVTTIEGKLDGTGSGVVAFPAYATTPQGGAYGFRPGTYSRFFESGNGQLALTWNAALSGATWNRSNVSLPAYLLHFGDLTKMEFYQAAAGANPITWTVVLTIDADGKLTGRGFYDSGEVAVLAGNTATVSHGLAARPRFASGFMAIASGAPSTKLTAIVPNHPSATQMSYFNAAGVTMYLNFYAML